MSICVIAAGKTVVLAAAAFTLSWTHSVEKIRWEEHWKVTPAGLIVTEARIEGSGAGMDPPDGSVFENGQWIYRPKLPPLPRLNLAASGATVGGWSFCVKDQPCLTLGANASAPIVIEPCSRGEE